MSANLNSSSSRLCFAERRSGSSIAIVAVSGVLLGINSTLAGFLLLYRLLQQFLTPQGGTASYLRISTI